ncbi:MAG: hypothetical protein HY037_01945 [Nitrospirae bacterium]|nr:hypothetical protein [Candidatus Troglogloeales bacterium]
MSILVKFEVKGMDSQKYGEAVRQLEKIGQGAPDGRIYHVCYGDKKNLQVIDVFENPAKLDAFGAKLMPILQKLGIESKPEVIEIHNIIVGKQ